MKSRRYHSTTPAQSGKSDLFFPKSGKEEGGGAFFKSADKEEKTETINKSPETIAMKAAAALPTWAERLKNAQAITDRKKQLEALTKLVQEALGPDYYVGDKTALLSANRNNCDYYLDRGPDGMNVNFDANQQEEAMTYYCKAEDGQFTSRVVLGKKALHPMGPSYTAMMNRQQQILAKGMEAKGWTQEKPAPTNSEKLQAHLSNITKYFFDLVSFNLKTCTPLVAFKFDGLFITYKDAPEAERVAAFDTLKNFYDTKIKDNTGNTIRFKIWLQTVLNDGLLTPNYLAMKINELPGLKLTAGVKPEKHICAK